MVSGADIVILDGIKFTKKKLTELLVEDFFPYLASPKFAHMQECYAQQFTEPEFENIYYVDGETYVGFVSENVAGQIFIIRAQYFTNPDLYKAQYNAHTELFD